MAEYELRELGHIVHNGFFGASDEHPKPFTDNDTVRYWDNVKSVAEQLKDPNRAEVIYTTMLLPLWESTLPNDRYYEHRKKAVEALQQYRDGVFSVFGNGHNLWLEQLKKQPQTAEPEKPMNPILKRLTENRAKYPEAIILLRVGDFYEAFDEDAHILAKTFDYTITSRPLDDERKAMVGFPQHIFEKNIDKLMKTGVPVVVNYPDGKTDIYPEPVQSKETDGSNREVDTLCKILDRLGIDDITIEYENGELVARDEDNVWYSKQLYDFLADEAFVYTEDGVLGIEGELLADFVELAKRYGIEIPTYNAEK